MTCREKMMIEHPDDIDPVWGGGVAGCPDDVGYLHKPAGCTGDKSACSYQDCRRCWDREIPSEERKCDTEGPRVLDSGSRREFGTGAVRDIHDGKGRCDLMPLDVVAMFMNGYDFTGSTLSVSIMKNIVTFQDTADVEYLFEALHTFSGMHDWHNHYTLLLETSIHFEEGAKKYGESNWQKGIPVHCYIDSAVRHYLKYLRGDKDEPHDRAFCWNILCAIWTCIHKPEMNDYAKPVL